MEPQKLLQKLSGSKPPLVLDVRSGYEFNSGHIPGAIHAPNIKILFSMAKLPEDKSCELVITCEHGPRAQMASALLSLYGYKNTFLLDGHMNRWRSLKLPIVR